MAKRESEVIKMSLKKKASVIVIPAKTRKKNLSLSSTMMMKVSNQRIIRGVLGILGTIMEFSIRRYQYSQ